MMIYPCLMQRMELIYIMKIIIVGCGKIGKSMIASLTSEGHDITIVDNFECQIKEVNWYVASDFDPAFLVPEEGFEYIVIVLSEKNTTDKTENAPSLNLLSADGQVCLNMVGLSLYKKQYKLNFGATLPDATAEAYVIYQIPVGAESFKLLLCSISI